MREKVLMSSLTVVENMGGGEGEMRTILNLNWRNFLCLLMKWELRGKFMRKFEKKKLKLN